VSTIITVSFRPDQIRMTAAGVAGRLRSNGMRETAMKSTLIAAVSALVLTSSLALAQNANTGSATSSGDAAISPATVNPAGSSSRTDRPSPGAGINSGAMNNGTTGDTIGTGPGTTSGPAAGPGTAASTAGVRKE
jgi:hypothetical protein